MMQTAMTTDTQPIVPTTEEPKIYVASLAAYNAGILHGRWINLARVSDAWQVWDQVTPMLLACPTAREEGTVSEEWAIHDFEGFGHGVRIEEVASFDDAIGIAKAITEHGDAFRAAFSYYGDVADALEAVRDRYHGAHESAEHYVIDMVAQSYAELLDTMPDFIRHRIDYDGMAHDLGVNDYVFVDWKDEDGAHRVHVFSH